MTKKRPKMEGVIRIIYKDATPPAFSYGLYINSSSAGLCEDEAGRIFSSRLVDDLGLLNKLWNGSSITVDRKHASYRIRSPRCTISWMVQPAIFKKYLDKKGDDAKGIGFLARCLVAYPMTTQGTRLLRSKPTELNAIDAFGKRIRELLDDQIDLLRPKRWEDSHD